MKRVLGLCVTMVDLLQCSHNSILRPQAPPARAVWGSPVKSRRSAATVYPRRADEPERHPVVTVQRSSSRGVVIGRCVITLSAKDGVFC